MAADMKGKVVVITGATSGIGQVAAERLAGMGARIVQVARHPERGAAALARLRRQAPGADHTVHYADLLRQSEMRRVATEIAAAEPRVDVLVNNAGAMFGSYQLVDGLERTFALNHMAYFVFAQVLKDRLSAAAPARVVNTASDAHRSGSVDLDDLQSARLYGSRSLALWLRYGGPAFAVYSRSKLCNILFRCAPLRVGRPRRPAIGEAVRQPEPGALAALRRAGVRGLLPVQALQHPLHPRAGPPAHRHRGDRQQPASRFRGHPL